MLTLTALKSEITSDEKYSTLDAKTWEAKLHERAVDVKFDDVLENLIPMYQRKISAIRETLQNEPIVKITPLNKEGKVKSAEEVYKEFCANADMYFVLMEKEKRLLDKLACCLKEQELRAANLVTRTPHHTTYYIDYTNGNDANDGLEANNDHSWKTLAKYANVTVRTTGDIALIRANQTHNYAASGAINFDEDGDGDTWISVIGCDATINDPWNDDSDTKPILDFGDGSNYLSIYQDCFWYFERIQFIQSAYTSGMINVAGSSGAIGLAKFKDCDWSDCGASNCEGLLASSNGYVILDGCTFIDCYSTSISVSGYLEAYNCTLNGGVVRGSTYGIDCGGLAYCYNCSFGNTSQFSSGVCRTNSGRLFFRNCTYTGTFYGNNVSDVGDICVEDDDGTFLSHTYYTPSGIISRQTASPRSGGSDSYFKMQPVVNCTLLKPLCFPKESGFSPKWLTKDVEYTVTVYARVGSAWDSALAASEAYLKVSYLSNAVTAARTEVTSTETIANDTTWTAFTVTFTPLQTGFAYFWFYLAEYEDASEYIDVDDEPVVS